MRALLLLVLLVPAFVLLAPLAAAQFTTPIVTVALRFPTGGETFTANATIPVRWDTSGGVNHFKLFWTRDSAVSCESANGWLVLQDAPYFNYSYDWQLPLVNTSAVRLRVEARNDDGSILAANCTAPFTIFLPPALAPPSTPTGFSATALTPFRVQLTWSAAANAAGYLIFRNGQLLANVTGTSHSDPVSPATAYTYQLQSWNRNGNSSFASSISLTTPAAGAGPGLLSFSPAGNVSSSLQSPIEGRTVSFIANFNQLANLTWILDNATKQVDENVPAGSLKLVAAGPEDQGNNLVGAGFHVIQLIASANNATTNYTWGWSIVTQGMCRVDAYGLTVPDGQVGAAVRNIGDLTTIINATLTAGNTVLVQQNLSLAPGQLANLSASHAFAKGTTTVTIDAVALCAASNSERLDHYVLDTIACTNPASVEGANRCDYRAREYLQCSGSTWSLIARNESGYCNNCGPQVCGDGACNCGESWQSCARDCPRPTVGFTGNTACKADDLVQREYRYANSTTIWVNGPACSHGCKNGACLPSPVITGCGIAIERFDYQDPAPAGGATSASFTIRNTGNATVRVNVTVRTGSTLRGSWSETLAAGASLNTSAEFTVGTSAYTLSLTAISSCDLTNPRTRSSLVSVTGAPTTTTLPTQPLPLQPIETGPAPIAQTDVSFFPNLLEVQAFKTKVIAVRMRSKTPQLFSLVVSGVPESWLSYEKQLRVSREETLYVFITPTEAGNSTISLEVTALSEQTRYPAQAKLYVAPALPTATGNAWIDNAISALQRALGEAQSSPLFAVGVILLIFVLIIALGAALLRVEFW